MKKLLLLILAFVLLSLPALAQTQIFCAGQEGDTAYDVSVLLAGQMDDASVVPAATVLEAVNAFLAADKDSAVYIGDPHGMILSLQGYTDADLRTAVQPVSRIASCDAVLYGTQGAMALCEEMTEEGLTAYSESNPFELYIARLIDASPVDYLTMEASAMFYVDQSLYMDYAEMAQSIQDGTPDLCVFGAEIPAELKELLIPLYKTGLNGPFLGAFMHTGASGAAELEAALMALLAQEAAQALLEAAGYTPGTQLDSVAFTQEVQALFQDYIQYLTNEGLFFYEF